MLVEEIDESNFEQKNEEGRKRVDLKLRKLEHQIELEQQDSKRDRLSKGDRNTINWYLFLDPTIWAYTFLKDKQNNPLLLRGFQDKMINDRNRFIVIAAANQIGKTWTACVKAIHHALHVNNASVLIVSKSESQGIMILDEIKWMLKRADIPFDSLIGEVENRTEIHLKSPDETGVSVIRCLAPTTGVLAYPATLIICDEIGFWEIDGMDQTEFFARVIVSRTNATKSWKNNFFTMGQIFCISNPNGQQGVLWNLWNDNDFHKYRYNFMANPDNTIEDYKKQKEKLPADWFDSIYAAVFSSATGGFITGAEFNDAVRNYQLIPPLTTSIYCGGDFAGEDTKGRDVDDSVLFFTQSIKENEKDMVKVTHFTEFPKRVKKEEIYQEIKKYPNLAKFAYDKVGVGDSVKNDLMERGILGEFQIEALTYSLPNKSEVYYNLKHLFEQRKIIVPNLPKLKEQLLGLRFERTEGGYIKVHHATEGLHDDWADALANACYIAKRGVLPYIAVIDRPNPHIVTQSKQALLICPECEKIDYKGKAGYYRGSSPTGKNFEKIHCVIHQKSSEITI